MYRLRFLNGCLNLDRLTQYEIKNTCYMYRSSFLNRYFNLDRLTQYATKIMSKPIALTQSLLEQAIHELTARDADLARVHADLGAPPMWERAPGFPTLVHMILEQQVSLASARAAFDRLRALVEPLTPQGFLELDDETLRGVGFSRQKTGYGRHLAQAILGGEFALEELHRHHDDEARRQLMRLKGIGAWTADVYLLMVLRRPDVWPIGDRALVVAAREVKRLPADPTSAEMTALGETWRPWRAVAARLLWHHYLNTPRVR